MPPFLAPELHGVQLRTHLRDIEAERFAIATLVFMLLHPGKPPYSHQGGEDPSKNVRNRHFPYPLGDQSGDRVPPGAWRFMWSQLPYYMKEKFHEVFSDGKRLQLDEWMDLLGRYENDLTKGYVSKEPFPTEFKRLSRKQVEQKGGKWRKCGSCGKGFGAFAHGDTTCRNCRYKQQQTSRASQPTRPRSRPSAPRPRQPKRTAPTPPPRPPPRRTAPPQRQTPPSQPPTLVDGFMKFLNDLFS